MNEKKRVVYCPKGEEHPSKKIMILFGKDSLSVHCPIHGWMDVEIYKYGEKIDFTDCTVKVKSIKGKVNYDLIPIPSISIGSFEIKNGGKNGKHHK
jgi:hypothetical protein